MSRICLACALLTTACSPHWRSLAPGPQQIEPGVTVRVWRSGGDVSLWGVRLSGDSLSGIPVRQGLDCTNCRIAYPVASIDSLQTAKTDLSVLRSALGAGVVIAIVVIGFHNSGGGD